MAGKGNSEMLLMENRLKTFKKWPYGEELKLNKAAMAAAGFYFIGSKKFPDSVKCFVCQKELDGWEEEDDPWEEHKSHAPYCQFIILNKDESAITVQEMHELEMHRAVNLAKKMINNKIEEFKKQAGKTRSVIENMM
ncbi:baculoviral IAP repeat-containing protein 5-like [Eriocheir sinensis]|uniref:baculoviral IAP repeat-containing protein 5-like n=1 Tax=Eriocheir sinensis TaxID=95602 RepID=UPI0021C651E7|nr:baculoviral IAP repeat-containing protein 5-like [Eriocheir sinensis]